MGDASGSGGAPFLVAQRLTVTRNRSTILRDVDLRASPGEVVGVLGPSGAGKSTLLKALVGEAFPQKGHVSVGGTDVTRWPLWKRARLGVGYLAQGPSVLWELTVAQNLAVFSTIAGAPDGELADVAGRLGLADRLQVAVGDLSAGERRRLDLVRATARKPRLLVCDEPFAGLDPVAGDRVASLLQQCAQRGACVVLADHHVSAALGVCSRAVLLLDGGVAATADAAEFSSLPLVRSAYLGLTRGHDPRVSES